MPNHNITINQIIRSYFDLYFKNQIDMTNLSFRRKVKLLARKRRTFSKIFISKPEIKYTNDKAKITLFVINRDKSITKNKYFFLNQTIINQFLNKRYELHYKKSILRIYDILNKFKYQYIYYTSFIKKSRFTKYKFQYLNKFIYFKHLYLKSIINHLIYNFLEKYSNIIRKDEFKYSLNQYKLNQLILLPKLSNILNKILDKKVIYNIVNLKSITHNVDIFTNMLGILIRRNRKSANVIKNMDFVLNKVHLPKVNTVTERTRNKINLDKILIRYGNSNLLSNINLNNNLDSTLTNFNKSRNLEEKIHNTIFNSINYKNTAGLRFEIGGRLTRRYRADRAIYRYKSKGGLRNLYSSYQGLSSTLFRGNLKSNSAYSFMKSKRRIGSFAVKG
jgi:hypothetical protein